MLIAFLLLVRPGLIALAGGATEPVGRYPALADFALVKKTGRRDILRCTARLEGGALRVRPYPLSGSGMLSSVSGSDGLVEIGEDVSLVEPGTPILFTPYAEYGM
jgi:molybdopterin molybdotransferase